MIEFFRRKQEVVVCSNFPEPLNGNMIFHSAGMLAFFPANPCRTIEYSLVNIPPIRRSVRPGFPREAQPFLCGSHHLFGKFRRDLFHGKHWVTHFHD
jgi:hypothetical protein